MKLHKRNQRGPRLKKKEVKRYDDGGVYQNKPITDVKDLLTYLTDYDPSQYEYRPYSEFVSPLTPLVQLPTAEVVTEKGPGYDRSVGAALNLLAQGDMRGFTGLLTENLAMMDGDLAAVYQHLGSSGVERKTENLQVGSSNLPLGSLKIYKKYLWRFQQLN